MNGTFFAVRVNCNKESYVQDLPNFKIQGAVRYCEILEKLTSLFLGLDIFCSEIFNVAVVPLIFMLGKLCA